LQLPGNYNKNRN